MTRFRKRKKDMTRLMELKRKCPEGSLAGKKGIMAEGKAVTAGNVKTTSRWTTKQICFMALFMGINIAFSSVGIPVPGGHVYLCDAVICTAALLLDPVSAMIVGGVGAFLGDAIFYPAPMWVSLVTHGLQAFAVSYIARNTLKKHPVAAASLGVFVGGIIMNVGYFLGKTFIYGTLAAAIIKIPFEILQAVIGMVVSVLLVYRFGLKKIFDRFNFTGIRY